MTDTPKTPPSKLDPLLQASKLRLMEVRRYWGMSGYYSRGTGTISDRMSIFVGKIVRIVVVTLCLRFAIRPRLEFIMDIARNGLSKVRDARITKANRRGS